MSAPPFFQSARRLGRSTLLGGKRRSNGSHFEEPIRTRKEKLAGRVEHDARLGRVVQVKKGAEEIHSFALSEKEIFFNYNETKSKMEENKKIRSKKKAHCGQCVRYRSWWKQGNIKMPVSEDHASCWVHKDLTVTTKQIQALLTAARRLPRHSHTG